MCGIAGVVDFPATRGADLRASVERMTRSLAHRGPDDEGVWVDVAAGVGLGHRRLSILDLSPEGHQPMSSASGRYVLVFNGEIYNFRDLRRELEGRSDIRFRGRSDTEVMLAGFDVWGIEEAVKRFNGMFAFAVWDRQERTLNLGRDRLGEKPLYYAHLGKMFLFGSELKALCAYPGFRPEINRDSLQLFIRHNYVPAPYSIYKDVCKLPPGHLLTVDATRNTVRLSPYWSMKEAAERGIDERLTGSCKAVLEELESLLTEAITLRMVADVPIGAFLSGGIDSSTIVALMQRESGIPIKTFTIGFSEDRFNEADSARRVAQWLKTDHTELYVTAEQATAVIPKLPALYDEPFGDSSQIPTFLVSQLARESVTVSLSGDGGDELFGGYTRYLWVDQIWRKVGRLPVAIRRLAARALMEVSPRTWRAAFDAVGWLLPNNARQTNPEDKLRKFAEILPLRDMQSIYLRLSSHWNSQDFVVLNSSEAMTALSTPEQWLKMPDVNETMMFLDTVTYLPDDILVKLDRASMGVSLESRVPFLDHRLVEFAWKIPVDMKIRNGQGKWLLRQLLYKYVPKDIVERPKAGFSIPMDQWLRKALRPWAEELLDEARLRKEGYFHAETILQKWREHLSGRQKWGTALWGILMFQAWLEYGRVQNNSSLDIPLVTFGNGMIH